MFRRRDLTTGLNRPTPQAKQCIMETTNSFGYWVRRRRKALDLTQEELAQQVGCAVVSLRKIEADERRPSPQMAQRLAQCLALPPDDYARFLATALGNQATARLPLPAAPVTKARGNLPAPVTSLVGRSAELAAISACLQGDKVRLVTLTGPVGVGKTRLALEVGRRLGKTYRDGACMVALAPVQDPALVPSTTATALGVSEARDCDLAQAVAGFLADREMLLIFDNFEHVLPAASFLFDLLATCPGLRLLVTSRARLHLYGEHEFVVLPLDLPQRGDPFSAAGADAVRLFCDRAQAARAGFRLTPSSTPVVADICWRLDGLPLAIELAAARLNLLSPQELSVRLEHRLPLLSQCADVPTHRQGLQEAIEWSYGLLSPSERTLLARLAVFVGGFSLHAAEVVCGVTDGHDAHAQHGVVALNAPQVATGIDGLLDQSLLVPGNTGWQGCFTATGCCDQCSLRTLREATETESRFSLLAIIREFALERLEAQGELALLRRRHAAYFAAWADQAAAQLQGPDQAIWLARLEREVDNLRAALAALLSNGPLTTAASMACALGTFWQRHGHYSEGRRWLEQVLAQMTETTVPAPLRARTLQNAATLAYRQGNGQTAQQWLGESQAIYQTVGDQAGLARVLYDLGWIAVDQENWSEAARLNQESLRCARVVGDPCAMVSALTNLGWSRMCAGAWDEAAALFGQAHELAQQAGHVKGVAISQANLGWIALHQGNASSAAALARESLHLCHLLGEREVLAECLEILAAVSIAEGDARRATDLNTAATALWDALHVTRPPTQYATSLFGHGPAATQKPPGGAFGDLQRQVRHFNLDTIVAFALDCGGAPSAAVAPH